ncbi:C40 family peptidase [Brachybacterium saurashtrense]|uniref:Hydrolase n=1 Tax=Brachybacterium saurashtrense TaxID=556288 RepID=A0A345YKR7_9MICO|nr:NlpC/P60 family protein [Brachybacterium saurashtrense]AXK44519.1 hydrolase [Brachybacterium saurashtrense]RRR23131.1 hydrolase [Brachybacterium saurashtrense]
MAQHNTHRTPGRAQLPTHHAQRAARGLGGAAVLGTVVVGTAFTGGAAQAAPAAPAAPAVSAPAATTAPAAPTVVTPSAVLDSTQKLRWGSRGGAVQDLQSALNDHGASLAVDGVFGPRTHAAVKSYQSANGLLVDGIVGPQTRGSLNAGGGVSTGGASVSTSSSTSSSNAIVDAARSALGTPYSWGGASLSGMDCSGLVNYAYAAAGIDVPRTSSQIANGGRWISQSEAQPGDIVAWSGHVAIYIGNGQIIDASGSKQRVVERSIWGNPIGYVTYR